MRGSTVTGHDGHVDSPTFLYDGDCAFCSSCARFIDRFIPTRVEVAPWQFADLARLGLTRAQVSESVWFVPAQAPAVRTSRPARSARSARSGARLVGSSAGPAAIADLLRTATGPSGVLLWRPVGRVLGLRPLITLAWPVYRWVARNRHRLPGGTAACAIPVNHADRASG